MNRRRLLVWAVLILLFAVMTAPQTATARSDRTKFTGNEGCDIQDPGDWQWLPNGGVHVRGQVGACVEETTDPRASGNSTVVANSNWAPDFTGPIWGTVVIQVPDSPDCEGGGVWKGTWNGMMTSEGCDWHGEAHGVSGCVEGLKASYHADCLAGSYTGTILDPNGE